MQVKCLAFCYSLRSTLHVVIQIAIRNETISELHQFCRGKKSEMSQLAPKRAIKTERVKLFREMFVHLWILVKNKINKRNRETGDT